MAFFLPKDKRLHNGKHRKTDSRLKPVRNVDKQEVTHYVTEIIGEKILLLDKRQ